MSFSSPEGVVPADSCCLDFYLPDSAELTGEVGSSVFPESSSRLGIALRSLAVGLDLVAVGIVLLRQNAIEASTSEGFPLVMEQPKNYGQISFSGFPASAAEKWEALHTARPYLAPYWSMMLGYMPGQQIVKSVSVWGAPTKRLAEIVHLGLPGAWEASRRFPAKFRPKFFLEINEGRGTGDFIASIASGDSAWLTRTTDALTALGARPHPTP